MWKKILTMGDIKSNQLMISYYITYSVDDLNWIDYKNKQVYNANNDRNTNVEYLIA